MLPKKNRLTSPADFVRTTKSGVRVGSDNFVAYLYKSDEPQPPRAGLIISKSVGNSVIRHRVGRRVRHVLAERINEFTQGTLFVVRALDGASKADTHSEITKLIRRAHEKQASVHR